MDPRRGSWLVGTATGSMRRAPRWGGGVHGRAAGSMAVGHAGPLRPPGVYFLFFNFNYSVRVTLNHRYPSLQDTIFSLENVAAGEHHDPMGLGIFHINVAIFFEIGVNFFMGFIRVVCSN